MKKEELFLDKWEKSREHRWRNALIFGLIYGAFVFLILGLVDLIDFSFSKVFLSDKALMKFLMWIILGFAIDAFWMFPMNEKKYQKLLN